MASYHAAAGGLSLYPSAGFPITALREIDVLLKLKHPNVIEVHEMCTGSNQDKAPQSSPHPVPLQASHCVFHTLCIALLVGDCDAPATSLSSNLTLTNQIILYQ